MYIHSLQPHQNSLILHAFMDLICAFVRVNLFSEKASLSSVSFLSFFLQISLAKKVKNLFILHSCCFLHNLLGSQTKCSEFRPSRRLCIKQGLSKKDVHNLTYVFREAVSSLPYLNPCHDGQHLSTQQQSAMFPVNINRSVIFVSNYRFQGKWCCKYIIFCMPYQEMTETVIFTIGEATCTFHHSSLV